MPAGFTPILLVTVDGQPVATPFYSRLVELKLRDEEGDAVDSLTLKFDDADNAVALPRKGARIAVSLGYKETGLVDKGMFQVETTPIEGDVDSGEFISVTANAVDLRKDAKGEGSKAYENKSLGAIVRAEAAKMKVSAVIAPELDGVQIDYELRNGQSHIDFVSRLVGEYGGLAKFAGGKLIIQKRGGAQSGSGQALAPIIIRKSDCKSWRITPEGRMQYGEIQAHWLDKVSGKRKTEKLKTGLQGPSFTLREDFSDQSRAKKGAEAEKGRLNRSTGNGSFEMFGRPEAQAGAPVQTIGFRDGISGDWIASAVEHAFTPGGGYITTVDVKSKDDGKSGPAKD